MVLDPFQILLNDLSIELNERNLKSLVHVCGNLIPGGQREGITSGWDIFSILRHQNVIGSEPEKMVNLLRIIKVLKRRDLVNMIKRYVQNHSEQPEEIFEDFESSSDSHIPFPVISSRSSTPISVPQEDCCRIRCCGFACNYNPCCDGCCCCVILAIVFSFLAIAAALAWYSKIPKLHKYLTSNDDRNSAGPYVIGVLGILAACSVAGAIYVRCCKRRLRKHDQSFSRLESSQPSFPETSSIVASYAASDSTRASYISARRIERPRHYSGSSGQFTASSSLASPTSSRHPRLLDDIVPDGPQAEDYPEFFTQEVDQDDDGPIVV